MDKLQDLSQSELQELLDNPERVESMALESDEVMSLLLGNVGTVRLNKLQLSHGRDTGKLHKPMLLLASNAIYLCISI